MALTKLTDTLNSVTSLEDLPNDDNGLGPEEFKAKFEVDTNKIKTYINNILTAELDSNFATKAELIATIVGQIVDGSVTPQKLSFDPATQQELDIVSGALTTHKSSSDHDGRYYTETEANTLLGAKVDKSVLTTTGDIPFLNSSGLWSRLAKGTALQGLRVNSAGTGLEYANQVKVANGSYSGDGTLGRLIQIGFTPDFLIIRKSDKTTVLCVRSGTAFAVFSMSSTGYDSNTTQYFTPGATSNGFTLSGNYNVAMNDSGYSFYYTAIGY